MSSLLSQTEFEALLALEKVAEGQEDVVLPDSQGGTVGMKFVSRDRREKFVLHYSRRRISILKRNHLFRSVVGLARLDLYGPPHRNPDGTEVGPNHLHLYREGYDLKWASEVPTDKFANLKNVLQTLEDFMRFCNVVEFPRIRRDLFS